MNTYDRIKLITQAKYITDLNPNLVKTNFDSETNITSITINQKQPFNFYIKITPSLNMAIIEFSSKILLDNYYLMISYLTIEKCFENICSLGYCKLLVNEIINDSEVISMDVTHDVEIDSIFDPNIDLKNGLINNLRNLNTYHVQKFNTLGFTIVKDVKTESRKVRLSIYDKPKELKKAGNSDFMNLLENPELLLSKLKNKVRIETNIKTKKQIRDYCCTSNSLYDVLLSDENVLLKIFNNIFTNDSMEDNPDQTDKRTIFDYDSFTQMRDALILKECNNDLRLVKAVYAKYLSPKTNLRKYVSDCKKLLNSSPHQNQNNLIIGQIRDKLIA